jgi:hypothetical protein
MEPQSGLDPTILGAAVTMNIDIRVSIVIFL